MTEKMPKISSMEELPEFETEAEEAEFWATRELSEEILNRMRPVRESDSLAGRLTRRRIAAREAAKYSGKINLRMSRSLHRDLSALAKRNGADVRRNVGGRKISRKRRKRGEGGKQRHELPRSGADAKRNAGSRKIRGGSG